MNFPKLKIPETIEDVTLDWLQQVFILHKISVVSFSLGGDARDGRGYLSCLNRVNLQIERPSSLAIPELLAVIIKTVPSDPQVRAYALRVGYFANEFQMYTKVLPTINSFLDNRGVASESRFRSPVCYYGAEEEGATPDDYKCVLVLEDFTASGYHVPEEGGKKSFDMTETKIALREVALLHASSAAYRKCKGLQFFRDEFTKLITHNLNEPALDNYIKTGFEITRKVLMESGDPLPEGLLERFDTLEEEFKPIASKAFISVDPANVNVIRHSDLWFNNIAFLRDDSGNAIHAKWFDFQVERLKKLSNSFHHRSTALLKLMVPTTELQ